MSFGGSLERMSGLNPSRFGPGQATQVGGSASGGGSGQVFQVAPKVGGAVKPQLAGTYEYARPGSFEKSLQTLVLNANGTCSYREDGETSMESYTSGGEGTWDVSNEVVRVVINCLVRDNKFKVKPLVKDITEGRTSETNVNIPITESEIANATAFGTNKWRIKK